MERIPATQGPSLGQLISAIRSRLSGVIGAGVMAWVMGITIDTGLAGFAVGMYFAWGLTRHSDLCMRLGAVFFGGMILAVIGIAAFWGSVAPMLGVAVFGGIMGAIDGVILGMCKGFARASRAPAMTGVILAMVICGLMGAAILFYPVWVLGDPSPPKYAVASMGIYAFALISGALINGVVPWLVETGALEDGVDSASRRGPSRSFAPSAPAMKPRQTRPQASDPFMAPTLDHPDRFVVTIQDLFEIGRAINLDADGSHSHPRLLYRPSYELRKSLVATVALQNFSAVPVELESIFGHLVFSHQSGLLDLWRRLTQKTNWEPYAIDFSYPPIWFQSLSLPKGLSTSDFTSMVLGLYDADSIHCLTLSEPFAFAPESGRRLWTLVAVLPDYVARVLAREEMHIRRLTLVVRTVGGDEFRIDGNLADHVASPRRMRAAEHLVQQAIARADGEPGQGRQP